MTGLHPLLVHFPLALLLVAFALELGGQILKKDELSRAAWWNQVIGTGFLFAAVLSGLSARQQAELSPAAGEILDLHQQAAFAATALFSALLLWRIASRSSIPLTKKWVYLLLFAAGAGILLVVAWYGGELVYRYRAGIQPILP